LVAVLAAATLAGQELPPPEVTTARIEAAATLPVDAPQPPRVALNEIPIGRLPPVPIVDAGLPQPSSAPCVIGDLEQQPLAGQFTFFRNRDQRPSGVISAIPGEPSAAASRDTYFATGNTYGALSKDSGMTWTHVNPFTLFPAADGGVCCDQRVIADPGSDLVLWYIQYRYSATTGNGGFRLAWSRGRDALRSSSWYSTYLNAFAFGLAGNWLDFPDIAVSNAHVYLATNVYSTSSAYVNSLVIRIPLTDLGTNGNVTATYYRRTGGPAPMGGGSSYRFTQTFNGAPSSAMYWASHNSTSSLRIFRWDDGSTGRAADVDRTIPTWAAGTGSSPGPDGRDWIGSDDHRIASGYINPVYAEGAFLWTSGPNGFARPQSYVRVQVFHPADRSIISTEDVFSGTHDFAYPAIGMNSLGHGGLVMSVGSSSSHVTTYAMLIDDYAPFFSGNAIFALGTGTNGAPMNRWGDYHSVVANPIDPRTFIGTGQLMVGGTSQANIVHRTAWFGRDDYTPIWSTLRVFSAPISGMTITVDEIDRNGASSGPTPFTRSYTPHQGYTLRAPVTVSSGGTTYVFVNWVGSTSSSPNPVFTVSTIGPGSHDATANYAPQATLTIDDRNVAGGVPIEVNRLDLDGQTDGTTRFTRRYRSGVGSVTLLAPPAFGQQRFRRWYVAGVAQPNGLTSLTLTPVAGDTLLEAEYCIYTAGSYVSYGAGCLGSNGLTPLFNSTSAPEIGTTVTHAVFGLRGSAPAEMWLGFSNTTWNGLPLPLSLGLLGANPACNLLVGPALMLPMTINAQGSGSLSFGLPNDASAIGQHLYSQVIAIDVGLPHRLPLVVSNGLDTRVGGSSLGGARCP
jgi:hypothetical protein